MGRPKQFDITLHNPSGFYMRGETVEGIVTLCLEKPLALRECSVKFVGKTNVRWAESSHSNHASSECYFSSIQTLWRRSTGGFGNSEDLAAGLYTFPFKYKLPNYLPSSFESELGSVRYYVRAILDMKLRLNYKTELNFFVSNPLDLSKERALEFPTSFSNHKYLCCLCCTSGPISGTVRLPRKGYTLGETVYIDADIENLSGRTMAKSMMQLVQVVSYHVGENVKCVKTIIDELRRPAIAPGGSDQWVRQPLTIPRLPPSYLNGCKIINIKYFIEMHVAPKGPARDLIVPVEIVIGNIPLQNPPQYLAPPVAPQPLLPGPGGSLYDTQPSTSLEKEAPSTCVQSGFSNAAFEEEPIYYQWRL